MVSFSTINSILLIIVSIIYCWEKSKIRKYKECVKQTVEMLRIYRRELDNMANMGKHHKEMSEAIEPIIHRLFSKMIQHIPEKDKADYIEQFEKDK